MNMRCANRTCASHTSIGVRHVQVGREARHKPASCDPSGRSWGKPKTPAEGTGAAAAACRLDAGLALRTSAERARSGLLPPRFGLILAAGRHFDFALVDLATDEPRGAAEAL